MSSTPVALGLIILDMGVVTYAIPLAPMLLLGCVEGRPLMRRALRFVPPAVLSALIVWRTKNALLAIGIGMLV